MKIDKDKIKKLRLMENWSQEQLSEKSGLSLRTIQRIEDGRNISFESLKLLATAFNVQPNDLLISEKQQPTTPIEAIKNSFIEFANFSGKASRYEYW